MKKLIKGIVEFRKKLLPGFREKFAKLALGQTPDTLFVACSDSRVVPNLFASTDPGDLFVLRNVGNLIPICGEDGVSVSDESEIAAIEFSLLNLNVPDIVICGHSECGAMLAICNGRQNVAAPHLKSWLRHGETAMQKLESGTRMNPLLSKHNELSQLNVIEQMEHLKSYSVVRERIENGKLRLHGWWFDIASADVFAYDETLKRFVLIDDEFG